MVFLPLLLSHTGLFLDGSFRMVCLGADIKQDRKGIYFLKNHVTLYSSHLLYSHAISLLNGMLLFHQQCRLSPTPWLIGPHTNCDTLGGALTEQLGPSRPGTVPTGVQTQLLDCFSLRPMKYQQCLLFFFPKVCFCICFRHMYSKNDYKSYKPDH